jgi:hypothetical protein
MRRKRSQQGQAALRSAHKGHQQRHYLLVVLSNLLKLHPKGHHQGRLLELLLRLVL